MGSFHWIKKTQTKENQDPQQAVGPRIQLRCLMWIYLGILLIDLLVAGSVVAWKCYFGAVESEEECRLAVGGTAGSVVIWFVLFVVLSCCAIWVNRSFQQSLSYAHLAQNDTFGHIERGDPVVVDPRPTKQLTIKPCPIAPGGPRKIIAVHSISKEEQISQTQHASRSQCCVHGSPKKPCVT